MNEPRDETLSRFVDGDLPPGEEAEVEAAMAADEEIAHEVARLRALRSAVRSLAQGTQPPNRLDVALEPLRRASPPRPVPWWQWAGAAAAVLAAAVIGAEILRREPPVPTPSVRVARATPAPSGEPFQLRPLPRFVRDLEEHLDEVPPPDQTAPEALEVIGPLEEVQGSTDGAVTGSSEATVRAAVDGEEIELGGVVVSLQPGLYRLRLTVGDGRITSAEIDTENGPPRRVPELLGLRLGEAHADGEILAELVVTRR